jgi:hypothetical protein
VLATACRWLAQDKPVTKETFDARFDCGLEVYIR